MIKVHYHATVSGGARWTTPEGFKKLQDAGWHLLNYGKSVDDPEKANGAWVEAQSVDAAKKDFEQLTGEDPDAEGCPCCGMPHEFHKMAKGEEDYYVGSERA